MSHSSPIKLKVASSGNFVAPGLLLSCLIVVSALLSTRPVVMTLFVVLAIVAAWCIFKFRPAKVTEDHLTSVIFPDGSLRLESAGQVKIRGVLQGQQWCNNQLAVLRYVTYGKHHSLVFLSAHQNPDHYRRLLVWLRQDLLIENEGRFQS